MAGISKMQYKHKIFAVVLLFTLLPFLIFCTFYIAKTSDEKVKSILDQNSSQLKLAADQINKLFASAELKAGFVNNSSQLNNFLQMGYIDDLTANMTFNYSLDDFFMAVNSGDQGIKITVFTVDNSYYNGGSMQKMERLLSSIPDNENAIKDKLLALKGLDVLWVYRKARQTGYNWYEGEECMCFYKPVMSVQKVLALIEVKVSFDKIRKQLSFDIPEGSFITYDTEEGVSENIIKATDNSKEQISKRIINNFSKQDRGNYYVLSEKVDAASHNIRMFVPKTYIISSLKSFIIIAFVSVLLLIGVLIFLVEAVSYQLTKRLYGIIEKMNTNIENIIENENMDLISTNDDMGIITQKVYELVQKVKEYYTRISMFESQKVGLELEILQSRINPHFLYNTLATIKWKCNNEKLESMIDTMVRYYRLSLNKGVTILLITDELKMIEEYLKLQKFAFESDFEYTFEIEEPVYQYTIIKHLLQPIVENAVIHGINGLETGGRLRITGNILDGKIILKIIDNGVGIPAESNELFLDSDNISPLGGYGIKNVRKRISLFYGDEYGIKMESTEGNGTTVIMTLPATKQ